VLTHIPAEVLAALGDLGQLLARALFALLRA
jgi:hypothetical protein